MKSTILFLVIILSIITYQTAFGQKTSSTSQWSSSTSGPSTKSASSTKSSKSSSTTDSLSSTSLPMTKATPKVTKASSTSKTSSTTKKSPLTKASTKAPSTSIPISYWSDPYVGGKASNPGAEIHLSNKSIDQVHVAASDAMSKLMQSMIISDLSVPVGSATLIIKTPRISDAKFSSFEYDFIPSNRIRSEFFNGRILANGEWLYKTANSKRLFGGRSMNGIYRATILGGNFESMNQLLKTSESKPMIQTLMCKANFSQFRVDIEGAGNLSVIENCDDQICRKIRNYFEDAVCQVFRKYVKEFINTKLATFPALNETYSKNHKINYGLQSNEPQVTVNDVQAGLEGKALWYGSGNVPFNPQQLCFVNRNRMYTFELSDYSFNTLFHQTHAQNYRYSANELLNNKSSSIKDQLMLNCSSALPPNKPPARKPWGGQISTGIGGYSRTCIGSMLENMTNVEQQYSNNDTGDFVFKSNKNAPTIIVQSKDRAYFDASNSFLELYGPEPKRQLLARVDIKLLRGDFMPKFNGQNITGSINIKQLELAQSPSQKPSLGDLAKLTQFSKSILIDMFNVFLERYGQFFIPLLNDFQCASPDFLISTRSMQVDCDIRLVGDEKPKNNGKPKPGKKP